jgi:glycosyltransferase involved in cell wall biosynthesis
MSKTVLVVDNAYLYKDISGNYYSDIIYNRDFFTRYTSVFEKVKFVAKIIPIDLEDTYKYSKIDDNIHVCEFPAARKLDILFKFRSIAKKIKKSSEDVDLMIYRLSQVEGYFYYLFNRRKKHIVELVNDPGTINYLGFFYKQISKMMAKRMISKSIGTAFVTERYLQSLYPVSKKQLTSTYSTIELKDHIYRHVSQHESRTNKIKLVHVSNIFKGDIKGHITAIKVCHALIHRGYDCDIKFIGNGPDLCKYKSYADKMGILDKVNFLGKITDKDELYKHLISSDIFLYPTRMEGLPRAVIEALSTGLPVISTNIAGIPEIVQSDMLFAPGDYQGMVKRIELIINDQILLRRISIENLNVASKFAKNILDKRRMDFYTNVLQALERGRGED